MQKRLYQADGERHNCQPGSYGKQETVKTGNTDTGSVPGYSKAAQTDGPAAHGAAGPSVN